MKTKYPLLLSPLKMRNVVFPNRVFLGVTGHSPRHRHPSSYPEYNNGTNFFDKSMSGAAGMTVNTESIDETGNFEKYSRDQIRELQSMASQSGSKVGIPIFCSPRGDEEEASVLYERDYTVRRSFGTPRKQYRVSDGIWDGKPCYETTPAMMDRAIEDMKKSITAAKKFGGFDYIEMGIPTCFLSAKENKRTDEYGGDIENRCRWPMRIIKAARETWGEDKPIIMRLNVNLYDFRFADVSHTLEECMELLKRAEPYIDMVKVSAGMDEENDWAQRSFSVPMHFQKKGFTVDEALAIKKAFPSLMVTPVSGINDPDQAEAALKSGLDAVVMARAFIADPLWVKKVREGRPEDIVPCIRCMYCMHSATEHMNIICSVNPRMFRERRVPLELGKTNSPKKVVVIGGGPGGCTAAITAAEIGHEVTLIERSDSLGGQLKHAALDDSKIDLVRLLNYLQTQVEKLNVNVLYNTTATPEMVEKMEPDALIAAIGATPVTPNIPGTENAWEISEMYQNLDMVGDKVAIVGGGTSGSELCLMLAQRGKKVALVEMGDILAPTAHKVYRHTLNHYLLDVEENWDIKLNTICTEIKENGIVVADKHGNESFVEVDTIVYAVGMKSKREEAQAFYGIAPYTNMIGDCNDVARIGEAIQSAYFAAFNI